MKEYSLEIPPQPLDIELLRMDLGNEDRKRILDFVTYSGDFDPHLITKAVGRNIFFPLAKPIGSYDTVQISGASYSDIGVTDNDGQQVVLYSDGVKSPIRPPQKDSGFFTHTTTIVSEGKAISLIQRSPLGSYTEEAAKEKYAKSMQAAHLTTIDNCPFFVPLPITLIHYPNIPDGSGGRQSALVWGCHAKGLRAEDLVVGLLSQATANPDKKFLTYFLPLLQTMGRSIHFLHQHGLCHYQMTYGNVSLPLQDRHGNSKICLYDWETLLPTDVTNPLLARAYDMSVVLSTNSAVLDLMSKQTGLSPELLVMLGYNSLLHFLSGYTNKDPNSLHSKLKLTQDEMFQSFVSQHEILDLMVNTVLPRIDDLQLFP